MPNSEPNFISRWTSRFAGWIVVVGALLTVAGAYYSVQLYKNLRTDIEELLPTDARSAKDLDELTHRIPAIDSLAVLIFTKDSKAGERFQDDLAAKFKAFPKHIAASVEYKVSDEMTFFHKHLPLFLSVPDLIKVRDYIPARIKFEREMYNPLNIFPVTDRLKKPELDFDAIRSKKEGKSAYDTMPGGYYATPDGTKRIILIYMAGKHTDIHTAHELSALTDAAIKSLNPKSYAPDLEIHYTGGVQNFIEEHAALIADLESSTIIVIVMVTLAMLLFYRDLWATAALVSSLFMGTLWTFGIAYFAVGYLNANSAFLGSIVIGNGINFGIIMLARYIEERRRGVKGLFASDIAIRATATATGTAALAAGLSYGSLILTRFRGFRQFGVIGLIGMVLCWISSFTVLPAMLTLIEKWRRKDYSPARKRSLVAGTLASFVGRYPKEICIGAAILTLASLAMLPKLSHDIIESDLNKLRNKESMEHGSGYFDRYQMDIFKRYLTPIVILPRDRADAGKIATILRDLKAKEGKDSYIAAVQTLDDFIPENQPAKIVVLKEIQKELTPQVVNNLEEKEKGWVKDFLSDDAFQPISEKTLPPLILHKFTENDGSRGKLVLVEPPLSQIAWNGKALVRWIHELRQTADSVAPGTPVAGQLAISADMIESISTDGPRATLFAFLAVFLLVIVLFRQAKTVALTVFALLLGVVWMFGAVLGFKLKINFLNFIALPITFGIGVDYGVNIFQRYKQEGMRNILVVIRETGGAVLLASLTTVIGYSSLLIAENQAFVSFGRLAVLGEVTCVLAAVVALPAYLLYRGGPGE